MKKRYSTDNNGIGSGPCQIKYGKITPASFTFYSGKIDLSQINSNQSEFELRGSILVINNSNDIICISSKVSAHTICLKSKYTIPPKEEIMIEFISHVDLVHIGPSIERNITLQNIKTDEAQLFRFDAQFINNCVQQYISSIKMTAYT